MYLGAIALGLLLHFVWTVRLVPRGVSVSLGGTVVLVAVALFLITGFAQLQKIALIPVLYP